MVGAVAAGAPSVARFGAISATSLRGWQQRYIRWLILADVAVVAGVVLFAQLLRFGSVGCRCWCDGSEGWELARARVGVAARTAGARPPGVGGPARRGASRAGMKADGAGTPSFAAGRDLYL